MSTDYLGGDTVGIVTIAPSGTTDSNGQQIFAETVVNVFGCVFESLNRGPVQEQSDVITAHERAWVFFPYIVGVTDSISNANSLRPVRPNALSGRDYQVQGESQIEYDMDGQPDHVFVIGEWHGG
jgi:hypothetical protein